MECSKGNKSNSDVGPVLEDTFKRHHYRKKREQNIEQPQIEKKEFLNCKTYHPLLESNVLDTNKTRNKLFEGMKKTCPLSRFVEIMGKSKCRKESEINKARELLENVFAKSVQFNINENLTKQENIDIFTKSHLLEAASIENIYQETKKQSESDIWYQQRLGRMTASNFYRISTKTRSLQNNVSNNAESLLKNLTEINKFELKATKHGTTMEPHAKLQVMSILKKSHKNFTSTNPGLKVDQIYAYLAASPDLLVTCHCCGNGVIEIKCPESVCESVLSEENLDYLIKYVDNLIKLKENQLLCTNSRSNGYCQLYIFLVFCLHIQWLPFSKNIF